MSFAMRIFNENREEPLVGEDKSELKHILAPALGAAINWIYKWWQYRNNEGSEIPQWLLNDVVRQSPLWIEV